MGKVKKYEGFHLKTDYLRNGKEHLDGTGRVCLVPRRPLWSFPWFQHHLLPGNPLLDHHTTGQKCHLKRSDQN